MAGIGCAYPLYVLLWPPLPLLAETANPTSLASCSGIAYVSWAPYQPVPNKDDAQKAGKWVLGPNSMWYNANGQVCTEYHLTMRYNQCCESPLKKNPGPAKHRYSACKRACSPSASIRGSPSSAECAVASPSPSPSLPPLLSPLLRWMLTAPDQNGTEMEQKEYKEHCPA